MMKKGITVSALMLGLLVWAPAYADPVHEGDQCEYKKSGARQKLLEQLPAEKEELFKRTMTEAREKKAAIRKEIVKARAAAKEALQAPEFNEALFKEKTATVRELVEQEHRVMADAVAKLAGQFTPEERKLLADALDRSKGRGHRGWSGHRRAS
jgi:uncharacterized membrane protein